MGLTQFVNSVASIHRAEHVSSLAGNARHLHWQLRKLIGGFPTVLQISHSRLYVQEPCGVSALVNSMGVYDYNNMNLIKLWLNYTCGVFFDVGANIGSYMLVASEALGRVVSFEPHPKAFAALESNIKFNGRKNVTVINAAVSDKAGILNFTNKAQLAINQVVDQAGGNGETIEVKATTLDQTCRELSLRPNIVKIDVEGYEGKVLDGFSEGIKNVDMVLIEMGARDEIRKHPALKNFLGPCYFYHDLRKFAANVQKRREDAIYIHQDAVEKLKSFGFQFDCD